MQSVADRDRIEARALGFPTAKMQAIGLAAPQNKVFTHTKRRSQKNSGHSTASPRKLGRDLDLGRCRIVEAVSDVLASPRLFKNFFQQLRRCIAGPLS